MLLDLDLRQRSLKFSRSMAWRPACPLFSAVEER